MKIHERADVKRVLAQIEAVNKAIVAICKEIDYGFIDMLVDEKHREAVGILNARRKRLEMTISETIAYVAYKDAMRKRYPEE